VGPDTEHIAMTGLAKTTQFWRISVRIAELMRGLVEGPGSRCNEGACHLSNGSHPLES
jgi:hypothetical protein